MLVQLYKILLFKVKVLQILFKHLNHILSKFSVSRVTTMSEFLANLSNFCSLLGLFLYIEVAQLNLGYPVVQKYVKSSLLQKKSKFKLHCTSKSGWFVPKGFKHRQDAYCLLMECNSACLCSAKMSLLMAALNFLTKQFNNKNVARIQIAGSSCSSVVN